MVPAIASMFHLDMDGIVRGEVVGLSDSTREQMKALGIRRYAQNLVEPMFGPDWQPAPSGLVLVEKNKGGYRVILPPSDADRIRQRAIYNIIVSHLDPLLSQVSHGFRPGRGSLGAIRALKQALQRPGIDALILADFANCFPSIYVARVMQEFHEHIGDRHLLRWTEAYLRNRPPVRLIERREQELTASGKGTPSDLAQLQALHQRRVGVPQGSAIAPLACGLYLRPLIARIEREMGNAVLIHYADNLAIACRRDCLDDLGGLLMDAGQQMGLTIGAMDVLHRDHNSTGEFLGYVTGWRKGNPCLEMKQGVIATINTIAVDLGQARNIQDLQSVINNGVLSSLAYFRLADRQHLIQVCRSVVGVCPSWGRQWAWARLSGFIGGDWVTDWESGQDAEPLFQLGAGTHAGDRNPVVAGGSCIGVAARAVSRSLPLASTRAVQG